MKPVVRGVKPVRKSKGASIDSTHIMERGKDLDDLDNLYKRSCHLCKHASKELARTCGRCVASKGGSEFQRRKRIVKQKEIK